MSGTNLDLGTFGNLVAIEPSFDSATQSIRYGFEVDNLFGSPSDEQVRTAAEVVEVALFLGETPFPGNEFFEVERGLRLPATIFQDATIEGDRVFFEFPVSAIPFSLSDDDLDANAIVAVVDPEDRIDEFELGDSNEASIELPFVRKIPQIMRNRGDDWDVPADLQERWLDNEANVITDIDAEISAPTANFQNISLEWILRDTVDTDNRAQTAYDRLNDIDYLFSENARGALADRLDGILQNRPVGTVVEFGTGNGTLRELNEAQTQFIAVSEDPTIDPLAGALGAFSFYAVPVGEAEKLSNDSYEFRATGVGVYALDAFEFNGSQFLGYWRAPDNISLNPFSQVLGSVPVTNGTYREYRDETGLGEDFLVRSDVRVEQLQLNGAEVPAFTIIV